MNTAQNNSLANTSIFTLLGIDGTDGEKETLVQDLEHTIWQSVMDEVYVNQFTDEEFEQIEDILDNEDLTEAQRQERVRALLAPKVPDLEQRLIAKTEEVKRGMLKSRLEGLMTHHRGNAAALQTLRMASDMFAQSRYADCLRLINSLQ